ncbi:hypothetical protein ADICYQ_1289 [Cyclobacterium qasimii M12-11B]|uniref:Uncharacterized protein n=1 Tax=Cyclobacterium qasimii M12-11B TaxID=641524 RepID=S7WRY7_9BACT|nr:hypothetical protein ADICYQ_1289 [Cyclobacterium qasimii M12-11B]
MGHNERRNLTLFIILGRDRLEKLIKSYGCRKKATQQQVKWELHVAS